MEVPKNVCKRVMIVDDNEIDRYIAQKVLSQQQFCSEVITFDNPVEALQYLETHQEVTDMLPTVIFLDIYMPEMSGFDFMEAYAQFSATLKRYCTVYIVSSTIDPNDLMKANKDENVTALQVKPIDSNFLAHVRENITKSRSGK